MEVMDIYVENRIEPIGLDSAQPRFSWKIGSVTQNVLQEAFCILVAIEGTPIWTSGKINSAQSIFVPYEGPKLEPRTHYEVTVEVWSNHGETVVGTTTFETGLMQGTAFQGEWITHGLHADDTACPVFCTSFRVIKPVKTARLYATALGVYECALNGERVGDAYFMPGWTNYRKRLQYQTYPIYPIQGENKLEITVGNGWYKGILDCDPKPNHYGDRVAVLAELHLEYADGEKKVIVTNTDWEVQTGQICSSEFYLGEKVDTTILNRNCGNAVAFRFDKARIVSQEAEPVRITQKVEGQEYFVSPKGEHIIDFGQNLVGFVEFRVIGKHDQEIRIRHAEALDRNKNLYTETLRTAISIDTFICNGTAQRFQPKFTYHGFRYIAVEGMDRVEAAQFTACVLHTDMRKTGSFRCGNELINQLQSNIQWGQRGNAVDIPTDCPQRDERLGWTGDAQVFCSTAVFNYDADLFYAKWLNDLITEQGAQGQVPPIVPNLLAEQVVGIAAWGDAATIIPWELYQSYGDVDVLERQFPSMKAWVDYVTSQCGGNGLWQTGHQYGDWLGLDRSISAPSVSPGGTDKYLVANAFYLHSIEIVCMSAELLQHDADAKCYAKLYDHTLCAFQNEYITSTGRVLTETQTGCVLVLAFGLAKKEHEERIFTALVNNILQHKTHLTTGFVGTPLLCRVLSDFGRHDLAVKLLLQDDYPSWLYAVKLGATTIWERWNSILPNGDFEESGMNSLNHCAYGAVGTWMYQSIAGIKALEAGYKRIKVCPLPSIGINDIQAALDTPYGKLCVSFQCHKGQVMLDVTIPPNTTAEIHLPGTNDIQSVGSGHYRYEYESSLQLEQPSYSMSSTLGDIWSLPATKAFMEKNSPGMYDNPMIKHVLNKTLEEMAAMSPEFKALIGCLINEINM